MCLSFITGGRYFWCEIFESGKKTSALEVKGQFEIYDIHAYFGVEFIKGGFYHFSQILKKNFFLALFYTFMHVVVIFKVSEHFDAPLWSYATFCACFFTVSSYTK